MVLTLTELKQRITDSEILSAKNRLTVPIQGIFIYTGHLDGPIDSMELNLDIVDPILVEMMLSGYIYSSESISDLFNFCLNPIFQTIYIYIYIYIYIIIRSSLITVFLYTLSSSSHLLRIKEWYMCSGKTRVSFLINKTETIILFLFLNSLIK